MHASMFVVKSDQLLDDGSGNRLQVVLHSATGQVYLLPAAVLKTMQEAPKELAEPVREELLAARLLVTEDEEEFAEIIAENQRYLAERNARTFVLMPAAYCNMGCEYCGQEHFKLPRVGQHREAVRRRLLAAAAAPQTTDIWVNWFGAEPMMGYDQILDLSAALIPACESAGVNFGAKMVTNGSLLTLVKLRRLYHDARVTSFEITLDGPPDRHDAQRLLKSGQRSFHRITANMRAALDDPDLTNLQFSVRTNVSRANQDEHREFAAAVTDAGLAHPRVRFYTAMVREWGNDVSAFAVNPDDVVRIERNWLDAYAEFGLHHHALPLGRKHQVCVTVDTKAEVIAPTGGIYTCTEQPLVPSRAGSQIGHVADLRPEQPRPDGALDDWNESLLTSGKGSPCTRCEIFPICGGQCPLVWREGKPACPSIKATLPMRLTRYGESLGLVPTA
jgi:uncharacterized protein